MANPVNFALDQNLGLDVDDPVWKAFFHKFNIIPLQYTDMKLLTEDMKKNTIQLSYLPSANFFYFYTDDYYTPIANALFAATGTSKNNSLLVVLKDSSIHSLPELKGKKLGDIHSYCTSSYFAPALLLWKNHFSIHNFFSQIQMVGAWQRQVDAVIAGKVDATMIQEDIWYKLPSNAEKTKIIAREENLPSPLIIAAKDIDPILLEEFKQTLFSYIPKISPDILFSGFIPYQKNQVENFFSESTQAFAPSSKGA